MVIGICELGIIYILQRVGEKNEIQLLLKPIAEVDLRGVTLCGQILAWRNFGDFGNFGPKSPN